MKERMKKNQSTFFITVQQFFEDLLEDSAFEWLENCKNKTFFSRVKKNVLLLLQCSITKSRSPVLKSLFYTLLVVLMKKVFVYIFMSLTQTTSADENPLILIT